MKEEELDSVKEKGDEWPEVADLENVFYVCLNQLTNSQTLMLWQRHKAIGT